MAKRKKETSPGSEVSQIQTQKDISIVPVTEPKVHELSLVPTWIEKKQVMHFMQKTPKEHVFSRKGKGGKDWDYVTGTYVTKVLNYSFGWNWDFEITDQTLVGTGGSEQVITRGRLTVRDFDGHTITKMQIGRKDVAYKKDTHQYLDLGNDYKASATDCLKKCASLLGIASDIYGKEEFKEIKQEIKQATRIEEPPKVPKDAPTPLEKAVHDLYLYAGVKGAVKGNEKAFIDEKLGEPVDWDHITLDQINVIKMRLMAKTVNRNNGDDNAKETK